MATISTPLTGREAERATLRRTVQSTRSELVAVYGRRRVGKTFLIRRFFQDQPVHYFEVVGQHRGKLSDHLRIFGESLSQTFYKGAPVAPPQSWHEAFRLLKKSIESRRRTKKKHVLFFDELPWLDTHRSGCLRELEHFWNAWCTRRDDIILVVCGSAASWMQKKIVAAKGSLHGRLTELIHLLPFTLAETMSLLSARKIPLTSRDIVELYMVLGGIPYYLDQVSRGCSVAQLVDRICLHKDGLLRDEFDRLFASLFDADPRYAAVVRALSRKRSGLERSDLLRVAKLESGGGATEILRNLSASSFVEATIPFGMTQRDTLYRLHDEFSLFHLTWMARRPPASWQQARKSPRWRAWAGLAFESVCRKHHRAIEHALGISGIATHVSAWRSDEAQIDLLIDRADNVVSVCEMKFSDEPFVIDKKQATALRNKLASFRARTRSRKALHLVLVTSSGVAPSKYAAELVDREVTMDALFR